MIILGAALSFLGLGVRAPAISWRGILGDGRGYMTTVWWVVTFLSVNLLGDAPRDRLAPGLRG